MAGQGHPGGSGANANEASGSKLPASDMSGNGHTGSSASTNALSGPVKDIVKALQSGIASLAVASTLLATIAVTFLSIINDDSTSVSKAAPRVGDLLYVASFAAVLLNISTTLGSFLFLAQLLELPRGDASKMPNPPTYGGIRLLMRAGLSENWIYLAAYVVFTFILGIIAVLVQVMVYVWLTTNIPGRGVKYSMTVACGVLFLPILILLFTWIYRWPRSKTQVEQPAVPV